MPFDYDQYKEKCSHLSPQELQREHQAYMRQLSGSSTRIGMSILSAPLTLGVSLLTLGISAPKVHNARMKLGIIEARMEELGMEGPARRWGCDVVGSMALGILIAVGTGGFLPGADEVIGMGVEEGAGLLMDMTGNAGVDVGEADGGSEVGLDEEAERDDDEAVVCNEDGAVCNDAAGFGHDEAMLDDKEMNEEENKGKSTTAQPSSTSSIATRGASYWLFALAFLVLSWSYYPRHYGILQGAGYVCRAMFLLGMILRLLYASRKGVRECGKRSSWEPKDREPVVAAVEGKENMDEKNIKEEEG